MPRPRVIEKHGSTSLHPNLKAQSADMSAPAVAAFLERLSKDDTLKAELNSKGRTRDERIAAAVEVGESRGFEFTAEER
jgi:hypothetical protein